MKYLGGVIECDGDIREELYLAGIPAVEVENSKTTVPYSIVGKIGSWTFNRAWYYWIARSTDLVSGLPLDKAMELHNRKHPVKDMILGKMIRAGGDCGCLSPDSYVSEPVYNDELDAQLDALGYKKKYIKSLNDSFHDITVGEVSRLCNEGKLTVERYVNCYHIDDQIGLLEFANAIKDHGRAA